MTIDLSRPLLLIHRALNTNLCRAIGDSRSEARRAFQCTVKTDFFINALVPLLPQEKALNETVRAQGRVKIGLRILQRIVEDLPAGRSRRGSDMPPAYHSLPRRRFATPIPTRNTQTVRHGDKPSERFSHRRGHSRMTRKQTAQLTPRTFKKIRATP